MTDGTSQGLFIVVAIVIFGIFTVMAYILFEDTLSPALATMFTDASEQANNNLNGKSLLNRGNVLPHHNLTGGTEVIVNNARTVEIKSKVGANAGVKIAGDMFLKENRNYVMEFNVTRTSGAITTLGGHLDFSDNISVFLNGELLDYDHFPTNNPFRYGFAVTEDTNHVRVEFDTNSFESDFYYKNPDTSIGYNNPIIIQPNRKYELVDGTYKSTGFKSVYTAKVTNLKLWEVK